MSRILDRLRKDGRQPLGSFIANIKETKSVARAGLNVRFGGWAAPAAAK